MAMAMRLALADLPAGFRFHPTDEELVVNYLQRRAAGQPCPVPIVADVDIYKFDPWELPSKASFGDREWYFFTPRDRKYPNGVRPNRSAASGFWKATGTDKVIQAVVQAGHDGGSLQAPIGVKKALVFYVGRAPRGTKTPWIMHEYRLTDVAAQAAAAGRSYSRSSAVGSAPSMASSSSSSMRLDEWVLCRIFSKTGPPSPGPDSDSPPADIPLQLEDLLAQPDNLINVMHAPPPAANIMYAPPASVIQNNSSSDYYYTDDSNMYSGMLLAIQEETADDQLVGDKEDATYSIPILYHCHCQQNNYNGDEAIPEPEPDQLEEAMANDTGATDHANFDHQEGDSSHNNAAMDSSSSSFSDQQIDSMLMDLAFFGNQHQQCSS